MPLIPICRKVSWTTNFIASIRTVAKSSGGMDCRFADVVLESTNSSKVDKGVFRTGGKSGIVPNVMGAFERMGVRRDLRATRVCALGVLRAGIGAGEVDCMRARSASTSLSRSAFREISYDI
jgi:hypothetical protein